jgi:hypothetical protein
MPLLPDGRPRKGTPALFRPVPARIPAFRLSGTGGTAEMPVPMVTVENSAIKHRLFLFHRFLRIPMGHHPWLYSSSPLQNLIRKYLH